MYSVSPNLAHQISTISLQYTYHLKLHKYLPANIVQHLISQYLQERKCKTRRKWPGHSTQTVLSRHIQYLPKTTTTLSAGRASDAGRTRAAQPCAGRAVALANRASWDRPPCRASHHGRAPAPRPALERGGDLHSADHADLSHAALALFYIWKKKTNALW